MPANALNSALRSGVTVADLLKKRFHVFSCEVRKGTRVEQKEDVQRVHSVLPLACVSLSCFHRAEPAEATFQKAPNPAMNLKKQVCAVGEIGNAPAAHGQSPGGVICKSLACAGVFGPLAQITFVGKRGQESMLF